MSETNTGDRTVCAVCGRPLKDNWQGWRHRVFCSLECEQVAARWQLDQVSAAAGHAGKQRPAGAGGSAAPTDKGQPGHAGGAATKKSSSR